MNTVAEEKALQEKEGRQHVTLAVAATLLATMGYRIDRDRDAKCVARLMNGEREGQTFPCLTTGINEADTGRSFAHIDSRRDDNFRALQQFRSDFFSSNRTHIIEF